MTINLPGSEAEVPAPIVDRRDGISTRGRSNPCAGALPASRVHTSLGALSEVAGGCPRIVARSYRSRIRHLYDKIRPANSVTNLERVQVGESAYDTDCGNLHCAGRDAGRHY